MEKLIKNVFSIWKMDSTTSKAKAIHLTQLMEYQDEIKKSENVKNISYFMYFRISIKFYKF